MQQNNFKTAESAFETWFDFITLHGQDFADTKAVFNVSFTVFDVTKLDIKTPWRKWSRNYAEAEWAWYLSGNRSAAEIAKRAPMWRKMMIPGTEEVNSNYGYFWLLNDQLKKVIDQLRQQPDSRRAVLVHWDPQDIDRYQYDTPCNLVLNFVIIDNKLCLSVFARSIDLVKGFCNDQFIFGKLMAMVAQLLEIEVGSMHWFITNLHVYTRDLNLHNG